MPPFRLGARNKKTAASKQQPVTAEEYLEAADSAEQTGGKHRAGDIKKAARAFANALEIYSNGVANFPADADLAYNKARLEAEMCQQPALIRNMPVSVDIQSFMRHSIASSKHAWSLLSDDAEAMFNTAQVMVTLAEYLLDHDDYNDNLNDEQDNKDVREAMTLLLESISIFDQCLSRQKTLLQEYNDMDRAFADAARTTAPAAVTSNESSPIPSSSNLHAADDDGLDGQVASVRVATTPLDLVDTAHALLSAIGALLALDEADSQTEAMVPVGRDLITAKIPAWLQAASPEDRETWQGEPLRHGQFELAVAAKLFSRGSISIDQYISILSSLGPPETAVLNSEHDQICIHADERLQVANGIATFLVASPSAYQSGTTYKLWDLLSKSQELFTTASKLRPQSEDLLVSRAEIELLRFRLGVVDSLEQPTQQAGHLDIPAGITNSASALLKNARKLYEAASAGFAGRGDHEAALFHQGSVMLVQWATAGLEGRRTDSQQLRQQLLTRGSRWSQFMDELSGGLLPGVDRRIRTT